MALMINFFEEALTPGWVYPCSLADIQERLTQLPEQDLAGLWAVGLAAATRKDCWVNGRYRFAEKPTIRLYSYAETLSYRLPPQMKPVDIEVGLMVERDFGMTVERKGGRYLCHWVADDLRKFTLEHVLLHEIGHHVHAGKRKEQGYNPRTYRHEEEQWAESYALRHACRQSRN